MQNKNEEPNPLRLYKVTYVDDNANYSNWTWMTIEEASDVANLPTLGEIESFREATTEETELYDDAYNDGYGIATIEEFQSCNNGVTFCLNFDNATEGMFTTKKMFECGICGEDKDFESGVASANGLFLSVNVDDMLWHVCFNCAVEEVEKMEMDN